MTSRPWVLIAALLAFGCQAIAPTATHTTTVRGHKITPSASPSVPLDASALRIVEDATQPVELIGKVKLISDKGLGIISNNSGGLISNNGGGLISDKGLGYRLFDTAAPAEALLADARLEVFDAEGKLLVDAKKQPISATSDSTGAYHFKAALPAENLVIRIKLFNGGTLSALLTRPDGTGARTLDIDTASTLGAVYVLDQYVKGSKEVYARLPGSEAVKLQQVMESAAATLSQPPTYQDDALVKTTDTLRSASSSLDAQLEHIKQILLVGQSNLGSGLLASSVALTSPIAVYRDAAGNTYIAESVGRVRKLDPQGHISTYIGPGATKVVQGRIGLLNDMVGAPDGTLYIAEWVDNLVRKITPDGKLLPVAGGGSSAGTSGPATSAKLNAPSRLALGPDGSLYIGEHPQGSAPAHIFKVSQDGTISQLPALDGGTPNTQAWGMTVGADGTVYAVKSTSGAIARLKPGAGAWEDIYSGTHFGYADEEHLYFAPDGKLYATSNEGRGLYRLDPSTPAPEPELVAGGGSVPVDDGQTAKQGSYQNPRGVWVGADGTMVVISGDDAVVGEVSPGGSVKRLAGVRGLTQVGNSMGFSLNAPAGITADPSGKLLFSEGASCTIKRLNGQALELVAGSTSGHLDGPAATAQFDGPRGLAYAPNGDLYVIDERSLRKVTPDGHVSTVAFTGAGGITKVQKADALTVSVGRLGGLVIDSQGRPVMTDLANHQVLRLDSDGQIEVIAGALAGTSGDKGDGGPATQALLNTPSCMAVDKAGNIYFADFGNFRIRKIDKAGNISAFAGLTQETAGIRMLGGQVDTGDVKAEQALFVGPAALCFDASGNLYVGELGSTFMKLAGDLAANGPSGMMGFNLPDLPARIRKITPDGTVSIVAGPNGKVLTNADAEDALSSVTGLAIDGQGRLAVVDTGANQIKLLPAGSF